MICERLELSELDGRDISTRAFSPPLGVLQESMVLLKALQCSLYVLFCTIRRSSFVNDNGISVTLLNFGPFYRICIGKGYGFALLQSVIPSALPQKVIQDPCHVYPVGGHWGRPEVSPSGRIDTAADGSVGGQPKTGAPPRRACRPMCRCVIEFRRASSSSSLNWRAGWDVALCRPPEASSVTRQRFSRLHWRRIGSAADDCSGVSKLLLGEVVRSDVAERVSLPGGLWLQWEEVEEA